MRMPIGTVDLSTLESVSVECDNCHAHYDINALQCSAYEDDIEHTTPSGLWSVKSGLYIVLTCPECLNLLAVYVLVTG